MNETECLGLLHWEDPGGNDGEGGGRGDQDGEHITPIADSCQCVAKPIQYCKVKKRIYISPKMFSGWRKTAFF